jgi:hypothetical protein
MIDEPKVVKADHVDNGVVVVFSDGVEAFYSADLLVNVRDQAQDISRLPDGASIKGYKSKT